MRLSPSAHVHARAHFARADEVAGWPDVGTRPRKKAGLARLVSGFLASRAGRLQGFAVQGSTATPGRALSISAARCPAGRA